MDICTWVTPVSRMASATAGERSWPLVKNVIETEVAHSAAEVAFIRDVPNHFQSPLPKRGQLGSPVPQAVGMCRRGAVHGFAHGWAGSRQRIPSAGDTRAEIRLARGHGGKIFKKVEDFALTTERDAICCC